MKMVNVIRLLAVFTSFFLSFNLFAQEECGTDQMIARNPFLQQLYAQRVACAPEVDLDTAQILTIPVVFHVIHVGEPVGEGTNISDEQILSCIENLNHRFRGDVEALAALTNQYDEYELSLVKDSKIEFCLAARDPNNEPTDGINRYDGSNLTNNGESYALDGIANDASQSGVSDSYIKDLFHWPVDKYFNCYVVTEISGNNGLNGIQGYSFLGSMGLGASGYRYGPVCLYNVTGVVGTLKSGRELNATWTHEIGHAFNLFHTFSNGFTTSDCGPETNSCTQGDQCPDTPPTTSNQGCSPSFADCPDAMLENYMDYTGETCKTAFTQNQIERMREEIWTGLPYLIDINNVSCQSPNSRDVAITSISVPSDWCLETIDFNVKLNNFGGEPAEDITLLVNGASYEVPTIEAGEYVLIPFTDFILGNGIIELEVLYDLDEFLDNNTLTQVVEITEQNFLEVILSPDVWSNEIDWEVIDENGEVVLFGGDYPSQTSDIDYYKSTCLPDGCYTFVITDSNGDGMCSIDFDGDGICDFYSNAFINIIVNDNLTFELSDPADLDFGSILEVDFCTIYCPPSDCQGDFDGDGTVGIYDLLIFLATPLGQLDDCSEFDFNNDLQIDLNDILDLLEVYGTVCGTQENTLETPPGWVLDLVNQEFGLVITEVTENNINDGICRVGPPLYFDLQGRKINDKGRFAPGIYLVVEKWSNGEITTKKIFLNSWDSSTGK
jgi:hypothetical protein